MTNKVIDNAELEAALDELLKSMLTQSLIVDEVAGGNLDVRLSTFLVGVSFAKVCKVAGIDNVALSDKYKEELSL